MHMCIYVSTEYMVVRDGMSGMTTQGPVLDFFHCRTSLIARSYFRDIWVSMMMMRCSRYLLLSSQKKLRGSLVENRAAVHTFYRDFRQTDVEIKASLPRMHAS